MELKELKQILLDAPEDATHIETGGNSNVLYWKLSESVFSTFEYWLNGDWVTTVDLAINLSSLSDIKTIVELMTKSNAEKEEACLIAYNDGFIKGYRDECVYMQPIEEIAREEASKYVYT